MFIACATKKNVAHGCGGLFDFGEEVLPGLEGGDAAGGQREVGAGVDVEGSLLDVVADGKGAESAEVDVVALGHVGFDGTEEFVDDDGAGV